jgi:hypothetical protein
MRRRIVGLCLVLVAVALPLVFAFRVIADHPVPVKASYQGNVTSVQEVDGVRHISYEAVGTGTYVGRHTVVGEFLLNLGTGDLFGSMTLTAANGDKVFLTYEGHLSNPTHASFTADVVGGTGRFANATGTMSAEAAVGAQAAVTGKAYGNIAFK